jgi:hypothetical protein
MLAMTVAISAALGACSSPTSPGETILLEGELAALGSSSHVVALPSSGVTTITVLDIRKLIWDITLGDVDPSLSLGIGRARTEECEVTGRLQVREDDVYLWSLAEGSHCFVLSDPGSIPVDGILSYSVRLDLPS